MTLRYFAPIMSYSFSRIYTNHGISESLIGSAVQIAQSWVTLCSLNDARPPSNPAYNCRPPLSICLTIRMESKGKTWDQLLIFPLEENFNEWPVECWYCFGIWG